MSENVLEKIIQKKSEKIDKLKKSIDLKTLDELINKKIVILILKRKLENNIENKKFQLLLKLKKQVLLQV